MKNVKGILPIIAFVFSAFIAVAFSGPKDLQPEYGLDGSTWRNVQGLTPGVEYECNLAPEQVCTRSAPNPSAPMVKPGIIEFLDN